MFPMTSSRLRLTSVRMAFVAATLLLTSEALGEGASVMHATKKQKAQASKLYRNALEAFDAKDFETALGLLQQSYNTVASPNSKLVIARTLVQLGRAAEAYKQLEEAVELAHALAKADDKYEKTAESAKKELDDLSQKVALVTVLPGSEVSIAGQKIEPADWGRPQPLAPGKVKLVVKRSDGEQTERELSVVAGERTEVSAAPPPPEKPVEAKAAPAAATTPSPAPPEPDTVPKRTLAYVSGALGLAGAGTFVAFTLLNRSNDDREGCDELTCPASTLDAAEKSSSYQTLAFVGLAVGVLGLGTSTYLFATSESSPPNEHPVATLGVGPGGVRVQGTF